MRFSGSQVEGLTASLLQARYDEPKAIPACHLEWWDYCCSDAPGVAIAAPRGHAKSTAVTHAFAICGLILRQFSHLLILGASEDLVKPFLHDIKVEFEENEELARVSNFRKWVKDSETELVGAFKDGQKFRIIGKGAGQRMRGMKWERRRPDMVIVDDLEDDESVLNKDRRDKLKRWFYGAVRPILKAGGKIRMVGTIVHMDSLLEGFMPDPKAPDTVNEPLKMHSEFAGDWVGVKYRAHPSMGDFSSLLWPEQHDEVSLRRLQGEYAKQGILDVYAQEYLNDPIDDSVSYFMEDDFIPSPDGMAWKERRVSRIGGADFAISQSERADKTALVIGSLDQDGRLEVSCVETGRWDARGIIEHLFSLQIRYKPDLWVFEGGAVEKSIMPMLNDEMRRRGVFLNIVSMSPTKDKQSRARTLQARMKAHTVMFPKDAAWYPELHEEMRRFPRGAHDDQVDALAWLAQGLEMLAEPSDDYDYEDELYEDEFGSSEQGRNAVTGY